MLKIENETEIANKILVKNLKDNRYQKELLDAALDASLYGRGGYAIERDEEKKMVSFYRISPFSFYPMWRDNRYQTLDFVFAELEVTPAYLEKKYNIPQVSAAEPQQKNTSVNAGIDDEERAFITTYWDSEKMVKMVNDEQIVEIKKHNYGFVPFFFFQNYTTPDDPIGESDVECIIGRSDANGLQDSYNIAISNLIDVGNKFAITKTTVRRPGNMNTADLKNEGPEVVALGPETEVSQLYPQVNTPLLQETLAVVTKNIEDLTNITELIRGRFSGSIGTGVFLSGLTRGLQDLAKMKAVNHSSALMDLGNAILQLYRTSGWKEPGSGKAYSELLTQKQYYIDIIFPSNSIQDIQVVVTTMSNLVDRKMISRLDALRILQSVFPMIRFPEDMLQRIKEEIADPRLNLDVMMKMMAEQNVTSDPRMVEDDAIHENNEMIFARPQEVTEQTENENELHLRIHEQFLLSSPGRAVKGEAREVFKKHINEHKTRLAGTRGGQVGNVALGLNGQQNAAPTLGQNQNMEGANPMTQYMAQGANPGSPQAPMQVQQ